MKKIILIALLFVFAMRAASSSSASTLSFTYAKTKVTVGGTFDLSITIDPLTDKVYSARTAVSFPADILEVKGFHWGLNWIALTQTGYDQIDNAAGEMMKTAGYPQGLDRPALFGTITFKVIAAGSGEVRVSGGSLALNRVNRNTLELPYPALSVVALPVGAGATPPAKPPAKKTVPPPAVPSAPGVKPAPEAVVQPPTNQPPLFDVSVAPVAAAHPYKTAVILVVAALLAIAVGIFFARFGGRRKKH